jgi:hypothetical protein
MIIILLNLGGLLYDKMSYFENERKKKKTKFINLHEENSSLIFKFLYKVQIKEFDLNLVHFNFIPIRNLIKVNKKEKEKDIL